MTRGAAIGLVVAMLMIGAVRWAAVGSEDTNPPPYMPPLGSGLVPMPVPHASSGASGGVAAAPSLVARARTSAVPLYATPSDPVPTATLDSPGDLGNPRVFLVLGRAGDWLRVLLPIRPNESIGWVRTSDVTLVTTSFRVRVELDAHRITVWDGSKVVLRAPAGIGRAMTSTPTGLYYLTDLLRPPDPDGLYGPYAFGLSGFSERLNEFRGGPGQIGIHGTNDPDRLGEDVSHGCIRIANEQITRIARLLPLGTPVFITR